MFLFQCLVVALFSIKGLSADISCETLADCPISNSICYENKCMCDDLSYLSSDGSTCYSYATAYRDLCLEQDQCTKFHKDLICSDNNQCMCKEGFRWYLGNCIAVADLGDSCSKDIDCFNGYDLLAMSCKDGKCTCSDEYYQRPGGDCRKKLKDACALDIDCTVINGEGYTCGANGKCTKTESETYTNQTEEVIPSYDEFIGVLMNTSLKSNTKDGFWSCTTNEDCKQYLNSECDTASGMCVCSAGYTFHKNNCVSGMESCVDNSCTIANSYCFEGISCICKPGYFLSKGTCVPELGVMDCKVDADCPIKPALCHTDGKCYCRNNFFSTDTNRECVKSTLQATNVCYSSDWCRVYGPYSYCDAKPKGACKCLDKAPINDAKYCTLEKDADISNVCFTDSDCEMGKTCVNSECICDSGYITVDDSCFPVIGGSCKYQSCRVDNSQCIGNECKCINDYVELNSTQCLKVADKLHDECVIDTQCRFTYSSCIDNSCMCKDTLEINSACYLNKTYHSYCRKEYECSVVLGKNFVCRNSVCACPVGYVYKNNDCVSSATTFTISSVLVFILGYLIVI